MPSPLNEIHFFQFDNLIRNRIPFAILNLGVDVQGFYKLPMFQNHLESLMIPAKLENAVSLLKEKQISTDFAILVLCPNGEISPKVVDDLEKAGFTNVFFPHGGFNSLKTDASH